MKALQLFYTSCRRGTASSPGFQIRAFTPGIQPEEQREVERRGVYRPPRGGAPMPSDEEIARDFPRALRHYPLSSGRWALTLASYAGRDYSGRWGNFFAHTLVFDGAPPPLWPIDYYEWEGWKRRLPPGEDTDEPPSTPPAIDLGELAPAESFALAELAAFLAEGPGRRDLLARMGRAALAAAASAKAVVVRDSPLNGLYWMACIQKLFPPIHALGLSFSTFQDDPRGAAAVNATVDGTDFTFSDAERRYRFAMFDLTTGLHSEIEPADDYPELAAGWLADDPRTLEGFFEFMGNFDHRALDGADLLAAAHLFQLHRGELEDLDGARLAAVLGFAGRHTVPAGQVAILERLGSALLAGPALPEPEYYAAAVRFVAAGAAATGQPRHRAAAFELWRRLWREEALGRGRGVEVARRIWTDLAETLPEYVGEHAERYLDRETFGPAVEQAAALSAPALTLTLELAAESLARLGGPPLHEHPGARSLIAAWMAAAADAEAAAGAVLAALPDRPEAIVGTIPLLLEAGGPAAASQNREHRVGRALGRRLAGLPDHLAAAIRQSLDHPAGHGVLFGEWLFLSAEASDLPASFAAYRVGVLEVLPGYRASCGARVAASALERMSASERARQAAVWVLDGEIDDFPAELRRRCLELANEALGCPEDLDAGRLADQLGRRAAEDGVALRPDRPLIRRLAAASGSRAPGFRAEDLERLPAALAGVHDAEYEAFLEDFLLPALDRVANHREHERLLWKSWNEHHRSTFVKVYGDFLAAQRRGNGLTALQAAIKFWLLFDPAAADARLAHVREPVFEHIVRTVSRLPARRWAVLRERLEKARFRGEPLRRWRELDERVSRRSGGIILGSLRRLLGRKSPAVEAIDSGGQEDVRQR